jgi:hypothetical protein
LSPCIQSVIAYRRTSEVVMGVPGKVSPLVEQGQIDEAYLVLAGD